MNLMWRKERNNFERNIEIEVARYGIHCLHWR